MSPEAFLLIKAVEVGTAIDWPTVLPGVTPLKFRHWRSRHSRKDERPIGSVRFGERKSDSDRQRYHSTDEECWVLEMEIVFDVDLKSEASVEDPTGVGDLTLYAAETFKALFDETTGLRQYCDDVIDEGLGPDDDSSADEGRLVQTISVLYRSPVGDPTVLLAPGVNL